MRPETRTAEASLLSRPFRAVTAGRILCHSERGRAAKQEKAGAFRYAREQRDRQFPGSFARLSRFVAAGSAFRPEPPACGKMAYAGSFMQEMKHTCRSAGIDRAYTPLLSQARFRIRRRKR